MNILLDTHFVLWFLGLVERLAKNTRAALESGRYNCHVSIVSLWEISIKHSLGKLELKDGLRGTFAAIGTSNLVLLDLVKDHLLALAQLPLLHRDPFDRLLIAQAKHEGMHLLTADPAFRACDVALVDL